MQGPPGLPGEMGKRGEKGNQVSLVLIDLTKKLCNFSVIL